jgi:hypothetical protein
MGSPGAPIRLFATLALSNTRRSRAARRHRRGRAARVLDSQHTPDFGVAVMRLPTLASHDGERAGGVADWPALEVGDVRGALRLNASRTKRVREIADAV